MIYYGWRVSLRHFISFHTDVDLCVDAAVFYLRSVQLCPTACPRLCPSRMLFKDQVQEKQSASLGCLTRLVFVF